MIQIINIDIIEKEEDEESGDTYYSVKADLMEVGGAFTNPSSNKEIAEKLEDKLNKALNQMKEMMHQ